LGAGVTLWVTFVPCFVWIFTFAPWVEALRSNRRLAAALAAITAAVVGVIANLSVSFATHVLFGTVESTRWGPMELQLPQVSTLDGRALGVSALAFLLIFVLKQQLGRTLVVCALVGALLKGLT
jgi:chromate transporter